MATESPPPYRREAFTHGLNIALMTSLAIGGFYDHNLWILAMPIEAALLWILPDLPPFKLWVERRHNERLRAEERGWFLEQLWGLRPRPSTTPLNWVLSLFVEGAPENLDDRVRDRGSDDFAAYLEMRAIVGRLRELVGMRGVHFTETELLRCEDVINGYLRLLIACRPLAEAVRGADPRGVDSDLRQVEAQLEGAEGHLRTALLERRALLLQQKEQLPRLSATLHLFRARAAAIVQQLRNIHAQVLADPGMNVNAALDEMMSRQVAITDPLQEATADRMVEEFLQRSVKGTVEAPKEAPRKVPPPRVRQ